MSLDLTLDAQDHISSLVFAAKMRNGNDPVASLLRYSEALGEFIAVERTVVGGLILEEDKPRNNHLDDVEFL